MLGGISRLRKHKGRREGTLTSYKKDLSSDAKIIVALLRSQPQKRDDLYKNAGVSRGTFYKDIPLLLERGIIKEIDNAYVLSRTFSKLDWMVEKAFKEQWKEGFAMTLEAVAGKAGLPPSEIEAAVYRIAKKYGMMVHTLDSGRKIIVKNEPDRPGRLAKAY